MSSVEKKKEIGMSGSKNSNNTKPSFIQSKFDLSLVDQNDMDSGDCAGTEMKINSFS